MPREEVSLDFSNLETYECGAVLLAVLAYPSDSAGAERRDLQTSLCAGYLLSSLRRDRHNHYLASETCIRFPT